MELPNPAQLHRIIGATSDESFHTSCYEPGHQPTRPLIMSTYQPVQLLSTKPNVYPPSHEAEYQGVPNSTSSFETKVREGSRLSRTPSPTPSEAKELESGAINWKTISSWRFWFRKEWICTLSSSTSAYKVMLRVIGWIQGTISH